ncbi:hypothetical protein [Crocosphaera sp.]|uniref:hypothetical protein n=1 Tax=Crocosphaera sp. TaxID=2729996 RepID=UPI003F227065|nr:hypothetical protein [Crocosphaera sp.]
MLQCKRVIPLMATLFSSVPVTSAEAITVNRDIDGNVTSVEDIQIVETGVQLPDSDFLFTVTNTYRIDFLYGTFNDIFGDPNQPDFDTSCDLGESNKLCFWQNDPQAEFVINQMNDAFNALPTFPLNVVGTVIDPPPPDFLPVPTVNSNFYYIPKDFNGVDVIISRQGRNNDNNIWETETDDFPSGTGVVTSYAGAQLTSQEFEAEIPESSNVIGIIVIGLSMILVTKKK